MTSVRRERPPRRGVGCAREAEVEGWGKGEVRAVCVCGILTVVCRCRCSSRKTAVMLVYDFKE